MNHVSSSSLAPTKSKGYRHRSRPARSTQRTEVSDNSTTGRVDGKHSSSRHWRKSPSTNLKAENDDSSVVIPFPVPPVLNSLWLLKAAPIALARHLIYARGLWPMSVHQLMLLQQQQRENSEIRVDGFHDRKEINNDRSVPTKPKRRRLHNISRANPSLRRKQQRAMDQITRLCNEWTRYADATTAATSDVDTNKTHPECSLLNPEPWASTSSHSHGQILRQDAKIPRFILIVLGSSYVHCRELYLLDFQSLLDEDTNTSSASNNCTTELTKEQERKFEGILSRKLISALMNDTGDGERLSVVNSLPAPNSPSFRLSFTIGFDNELENGTFPDVHGPMDGENISLAESTPNPDSPFTVVSWIPRTKFPFSKQKSQSRPSSQKQSLVIIRFGRTQQHQPSHQNQVSHHKEAKMGDHVSTLTRSRCHMSDKLTWMSLSTCVKGFRL